MGRGNKATKTSKSLVKKGISKSSTASAPQKPSLEDLTNIIAHEPASRGKRKRAMKRARLESRKAFIEVALRSRKQICSTSEFGQALGDFADLEGAIDEITPPTAVVAEEKTKKSKWSKGALKRSMKVKSDSLDLARFETLMSIPEFASDPLAAIETHLLNAKAKRDMKKSGTAPKNTEMEVS